MSVRVKITQREQESVLPALPREEPIKYSNMAEYIEKGEHTMYTLCYIKKEPGPLEFGGTGPRLLSVSTTS